MTTRNIKSPFTRFMQKVNCAGDDCWLWKGAVSGNGYGLFTVREKNISAHRFSYESVVGAIPYGLMVCHSCDNRICVNPSHLFLGSSRDNHMDMQRKGRGICGERVHSAKLTWKKVKEIRAARQVGESRMSLSIKFGVGPRAIWNIATGRTWKGEEA